MTDPVRLMDSGDPAVRRLLESASGDRPGTGAARATLVALGVSAPAVATAAVPVGAAAKGTLAAVLGSITVKLVVAATAAAVAGSAIVVAVKPHRPPPPAQVVPVPVSTLAEESALLRTAADALAAHQPSAALAALKEHSARFPKALLAEEAAALTVEALDQLGEAAAARDALKQFETRYPDSPFSPVINSPPPGDESLQAEQGDSK